MKQPKYHIIGHRICPYVQRVVILMEEKQISYKRTDIELHNKPNWLEAVSPTGKVPVLVVNDSRAIFESGVICEYLDEVSTGSLHPANILQKANHRAWIEFASDILNLVAKIIYRDKSAKCINTSLTEIAGKLRMVESELSKGEYFSESGFHIIDGVYATLFRYFEVFERLTQVDLYANLPHIKRWSQALLERESVQQAVPKNYNQLLLAFMQQANSYLTREEALYPG